MNANYTKWEWEFILSDENNAHLLLKQDHESFIEIYTAIDGEAEAIAHLIIAARGMYETLTLVQKLLREQYEILLGNYPKYGTIPELEAVNQALAKAYPADALMSSSYSGRIRKRKWNTLKGNGKQISYQ